MTAVLENGLPANVDAERTIMGSILLENSCFLQLAQLGDHPERFFFLDSHQRIIARAGAMIRHGSCVDLVTICDELGKRHELQSIGGAAYLASLTEGIPRRLNIEPHIRIIHDKWQLRQTIATLTDGVARAAEQSESAGDLIADVDRRLLEIAHAAEQEEGLVQQTAQTIEGLRSVRDRRVEASVSTGVQNLDHIVGGYKRKRLYVAGGRPSMGKTSLMVEAAIQHCVRGMRTRLVSTEMTSEELLQRIFAAVSEISFERLIEPDRLAAEEWESVEQARRFVDTWPLEIDDRDGQTIDRVLAGCRMSCRRRATTFVALDYIQNLRFTGPGKLRYQEISDAAQRCREFSKSENVAFLLLSSITESGDKNPNRRPVLADLRGSGDLPFHADVAILVHREREEDSSIAKASELIVAKQRGGRTGIARAIYNTDTLLFEDRFDRRN
jgi:replicative DNA helicase